ncbi:MAG: histidinol-phosphate transaminase [Syntrophales bacterium]|nr:histidinol-phosphate transaminase [Syntrophales bacterium]
MPRVGRRDFLVLAGSAGLGAVAGCVSGRGSIVSADYSVNPRECSFPIILNSNESPYGAPPSALEAGSKAVTNLSNRYVREQRNNLVADLAGFFGLKQDQILLGCGAIELLKMAADVFCSPDKPPVISDPVYEAIGYFAGLRYISPIKVPAGNGCMGHDLQAMLDTVYGRGGGMVYLCNPCNPTGNVLVRDELTDFIRQIPRDVIIIVDEAYAEYVGPGFYSCLDYVRSGMPNLLVIRTFSKVYGMAGLRVGYCAGSGKLINAMAGHRLWNNINQAGAAAAREALKHSAWVDKVRGENEKTMLRFCRGLESLGIDYIPSSANYVLMSAGILWEDIHLFLYGKGIVAGRKISSMPYHIRISLGYPEEMDYCIEVLSGMRGMSSSI